MDKIFWLTLFVVWFVAWRPGMVEWWLDRPLRKQVKVAAKRELRSLENVQFVDDMFKE